MKSSALLTFATCMALPAFAIESSCEIGKDNIAQILDCTQKANEEAVNSAYASLDAKLKKQDAEASQLLARSQLDWRAFVTSSCRLYPRIQSTEIPRDAESNCWTDFSKARVKVLQSWETRLRSSR